MRAVLPAAIFLGALLLFLVEPMAAKMLLPSFGGSAVVWICALLFFQAALLLGYAWADWLARTGRARAHLAALLMGCAFLPVAFHLCAPSLPPNLRVLAVLGAG